MLTFLVIIYILLFIFGGFSIFSLFYSEGRLIRNKIGVILTVSCLLIYALIAYTSFPSNEVGLRSLSLFFSIIGGIGGGFIFLAYESRFQLARILILISIIGNGVLIFL